MLCMHLPEKYHDSGLAETSVHGCAWQALHAPKIRADAVLNPNMLILSLPAGGFWSCLLAGNCPTSVCFLQLHYFAQHIQC